MFVISSICVIIALWAYLAYRVKQFNKTAPPLLKYSLPVIGHLHYLLQGNDAHLINMHEVVYNATLENGGEVSRLMIGPIPFYIISDPEDILTVANTCLSKPSFPYAFIGNYLGLGLFTTLDSNLWKAQRKALNPAFNQQKQDEYLYVFNDESRALVKKLKKHVEGAPFDQMNYFKIFALDNLIRTALDLSEEDSETKNVLIEDSSRILELEAIRITSMWMYFDFLYFLTAYGKEERERITRLNHFVEKIVNKKRMQLKNDLKSQTLADKKIKPYVNILLELEENGLLTKNDVMDQTNTIIAAGFHTTAVTLSFLFCAIGTYPHVQDRLYAELVEVCGTTDSDVQRKDLARLVYFDAVIKETLRHYPVGTFVTRYGDTAVKLKNYTIPKNSVYILNINTANHLSFSGPDSHNFRPERWLESDKIPETALSSFFFGRRSCIGKQYALNLMKITGVHILRHYKIKSNIHKSQLRLDFLFSLHDGHEISIERRQ